MRFAIEAWATEYGSPMEADLVEISKDQVDTSVERAAEDWRPLMPNGSTEVPERVLFTDGVRRIDARVWIDDVNGASRPGVCATYAAGAICCDGRAKVVAAKVERGLFSAVPSAEAISCKHATYDVRRSEGDAPEQLWTAIQQRMSELEATLAGEHDVDLVVVDGPLRVNGLRHAVGYVKTHHVSYLPAEVDHVVAALAPGQRTPVFLTTGRWARFSWYVRLPGGEGHSWSGIVRCETTGDLELKEAIALADQVTVVLPRFASESHKDPRAPQNLYPIAGLERELRRRLGDPALLYRGLRVAAARDGAA